jgi:hypothetical protein
MVTVPTRSQQLGLILLLAALAAYVLLKVA